MKFLGMDGTAACAFALLDVINAKHS